MITAIDVTIEGVLFVWRLKKKEVEEKESICQGISSSKNTEMNECHFLVTGVAYGAAEWG